MRMKKSPLKFVILLFMFSLVGLLGRLGIRQENKSLLSPLAGGTNLNKTESGSTSRKVVFGFLPYWNLQTESSIRYELLTHLAFFGFDVAADGSIRTRTPDRFEEPGWTAYKSATFGTIVRKAHDRGTNVVLVLRAFDNDTIESVLLNKTKHERLIRETLDIVSLKNLDGVNVDFEYVGSPPVSVKNRFVEFMEKLRTACTQNRPTCHLSVDAYADAADSDRLWNFERLSSLVDHVIIMGYDFTRPTSEYSGPVAPLDQIKKSVASYTRLVSPEKLLLGVPYYGYEWPTYSKEPISKTLEAGYIATYKRIKEMVLNASTQLGWHDESFTPYLISTDSGKTTQVFYDDSRSLSLKYDFVNETGLAGVAIWAIGYDAPHSELWALLNEKFPLR